VADDASRPSQSAQVTPQTAEMRKLVAELAERVAAMERERQREEILASAGRPQPPPSPPPPGRRKRTPPEKRWLRVVPAFVPLGWFTARRIALGTATAAVLTAGTLAPEMAPDAPAAQVPRPGFAVPHHRVQPAAVPAVAPSPGVRKRRRLDQDPAAAPHAPASPAPSPAGTGQAPAPPGPSPVPSVLPTVPVTITPEPLPTVPVPLPTCLNLTGHHCHDPGDVVSDAAGVLGLS